MNHPSLCSELIDLMERILENYLNLPLPAGERE
jgi:hypothetical protein